MTNVCIYHGVDLDGYCSGAIWKASHPNCELIGLNYGQDVPWDRLVGATVAVLDFCLQPWPEMVRLLSIASRVVWIDHHKSAIEAAGEDNEHICGVRDVSKAACELTWEYLHPNAPMPRGVFLLGDYDCWRHSDPDTMTYQMGMRLYDMDPVTEDAMNRWSNVFHRSQVPVHGDSAPNVFHEEVLQAGRTILTYQSQQNARAAKAIWFPVEFDGRPWMAVNQGGINSQFWDAVWDPTFDGKLSFVRSRKHWTVSLYSDTVDCSEIAKRYGGGGHRGASGFQCQELPFSFNVKESNES